MDFGELGLNAGYVAELKELFSKESSLVEKDWRSVFSNGNGAVQAVSPERPQSVEAQKIAIVLLDTFRRLGHLIADLNPLESARVSLPEAERIKEFLSVIPESLREERVRVLGFAGEDFLSLGELISRLQSVYSSSVGFEFEHLNDWNVKDWFVNHVETNFPVRSWFSKEEKIGFLKSMLWSETFDSALHTTFLGAKRFSLAGGDALHAMLDALLLKAEEYSLEEVFVGMAHRGRLSLLNQFAGKPASQIASEFRDQTQASVVGAGDVKYHLGWSSRRTLRNGYFVTATIPPNPSHLEFVAPVLEGMVRAKQDNKFGQDKKAVLPILIHGDASFSGQGVVSETLNLSRVAGYRTFGTIHVIINNQIGFTTSYQEGHSTAYCSDLAKGFDVPVLHVNADDVEAACWVMQTALDYRQKFSRDIVIDLICYRKYGHNEGDDPSFTQPQMYKEISQRKAPSENYAVELEKNGIINSGVFQDLKSEIKQKVDEEINGEPLVKLIGEGACAISGKRGTFETETKVPEEKIRGIAASLTRYPEGFNPHPKLKNILEKRMSSLESSIDWGAAEALSFGTLLSEGISIRLSGQDVGRGTFSHRHCELHDYESGYRYYPLQGYAEQINSPAKFEAFNSPLSETAVLGFEFGYATQTNTTLTIWEAQFGDFANGAQVIIDQFIASSEQKWEQVSGVVLLLPHGFEGQGPEHSSARLERFLQLAAGGNMRICYPTNSAQIFHLLRQQGHDLIKRPLVVMTPKSLLRLPQAACTLDDLTESKFQTIITNEYSVGKGPVNVVCCSGKVFYDIENAVKETTNTLVLRFEQLYPFPLSKLEKILADREIGNFIWVQEEPHNMGGYQYVKPVIEGEFGVDLKYVGRPASASPATGSPSWHLKELNSIITALKGYLS